MILSPNALLHISITLLPAVCISLCHGKDCPQQLAFCAVTVPSLVFAVALDLQQHRCALSTTMLTPHYLRFFQFVNFCLTDSYRAPPTLWHYALTTVGPAAEGEGEHGLPPNPAAPQAAAQLCSLLVDGYNHHYHLHRALLNRSSISVRCRPQLIRAPRCQNVDQPHLATVKANKQAWAAQFARPPRFLKPTFQVVSDNLPPALFVCTLTSRSQLYRHPARPIVYAQGSSVLVCIRSDVKIEQKTLTKACIADKATPGGYRDARSELAIPRTTIIPRPQTPDFKRTKTGWHGLPSPQTPSCTTKVSAQQSAACTNDEKRENTMDLDDDLRISECTDRNPKASVSPTTPYSDLTADSGESIDLLKHDQLTPSTSIGGDAELALQLSSHSSIRRSTRIRNKVKNQGKPKS